MHGRPCPCATLMNPMPSSLDRFVTAQARDYPQALAELRAGRKRTHWIWYVLPQLRELGRSPMAREYGITDRREAADYLAHPVLGPRLIECVQALLSHPDKTAVEMLGEVDAMKLRSCLTLFAAVAPHEPYFAQALQVFYRGEHDAQTLRLLGPPPHASGERDLDTLLCDTSPPRCTPRCSPSATSPTANYRLASPPWAPSTKPKASPPSCRCSRPGR